MISLKKLYGDELLKLALILSLLKADPSDYLERETQQLLTGLHISNGTDWSLENEARTLITPRFIHPKSVDNILINYEQDIFQELNSLGRYSHLNTRMWNSNTVHTYLVNNVATETVNVATSNETDDGSNDSISADDNVAQEVKISDEDSQGELAQAVVPTPDAVVTITPGYLVNRTAEDVFAEIASRSFDVNEFLVNPADMQIKKEQEDELLNVKVEKDSDDLYSDNAIDDFVSYFAGKSEKFDIDESNSVFDQNMADLQEYRELFNEYKDMKNDFEHLDVKEQQEDLEQYLLKNTPLEESDEYDLAPMFDEELVIDVKRERASTSFTSSSSSGVSDMDVVLPGRPATPDVKIEPDEGNHSGDELTQEDMDLINVLWKQDVDMGFCLDAPKLSDDSKLAKKTETDDISKKDEDNIEKVKALLLDDKEEDPWAGLSYTVDTETGEYVLQGELPSELVTEDTRFDLLEEALQLVGVADEATSNVQSEAVEGGSGSSSMLHPAMARHAMPPHHPLAHYHNQSLMRSMSVEQRWQDLASLLTIPPPPDQYQHYHHHHHQQHQHNISAHGAAGGYAPNYAPIAPPMAEKHHEAYGAAAPLDGGYKVESAHLPQQHDGVYYQNPPAEMPANPGSDGFLQSILNDEDLQLMDMAMNEAMNLPMVPDMRKPYLYHLPPLFHGSVVYAPDYDYLYSHYKHYDGMYTMRVLDGGPPPHHVAHQNHTTHMMMTQERDSASDSAVSSMGSERVPSLSDGEWCDAGSDSPQEYHSSKFRPYEAAYRDRPTGSQPPQKKHHMFGKRCFQEPVVPNPGVVKYESPEPAMYHELHSHHAEYPRHSAVVGPPLQPALDLNHPHSSHALLQPGVSVPRLGCERVRHNHTYAAVPLAPGAHDSRPMRDKRVRRLTEGSMSDAGSTASGHLSRDEKRAKALGIPLEVSDIINLPMDEFNERLSKHDLSEAQLSLIRDIRRRGKNKVAAQNCRKRKLDQISHLADEVRTVRDRKARTHRDHVSLAHRRRDVKERFAQLYRHVFQNLRDAEGRPLSSSQYSLQQAADGNVVLVPKINHHNDSSMNRTSDEEMDRKAKSYDQ